MIHFVGAGPGAVDLITVRGQKLLGEADIIIYAGSLVNPALLDLKKEGCVVYNSATMTLEQVIDVMKEAESKGQNLALNVASQTIIVFYCPNLNFPVHAVMQNTHYLQKIAPEPRKLRGNDDISFVQLFEQLAELSLIEFFG